MKWSGRRLLTTTFNMTKSSLAIFWMDFSAAKTFFSAAEKPKKGDNIFSLTGKRQVYLHPSSPKWELMCFTFIIDKYPKQKPELFFSLVFSSCRWSLLFMCCRNQSGSCLYRTSWVTNGLPTTFSFTGSEEHARNVPRTDGGRWANLYSCIFTCFQWGLINTLTELAVLFMMDDHQRLPAVGTTTETQLKTQYSSIQWVQWKVCTQH